MRAVEGSRRLSSVTNHVAWHVRDSPALAPLANECAWIDLDDTEAVARDGRVAEEVAEIRKDAAVRALRCDRVTRREHETEMSDSHDPVRGIGATDLNGGRGQAAFRFQVR